MIDFSSLNPYETLQAISGNSPEELVSALRSIRTPIKIVAIVPNGTRQVAYVMGDVRINKKPRGKKNGSEDSSST